MKERIYEGRRGADGSAQVYYLEGNERWPLPLRLDLESKSPTGFNWGYAGSGPAQLALALLADALGDDSKALRCYQMFKQRFVCSLDQYKPWAISREAVKLMAGAIEVDQGRLLSPMRRDAANPRRRRSNAPPAKPAEPSAAPEK